MPSTAPALVIASEEVLKKLLDLSTDLKTLVDTRIAPDQAPLDWKDLTHLVYAQQSDRRQRLLSGAETGLRHTRYSLYCVDRSRAKSRLLAQVVRAAITVNAPTVIAGVKVCQVYVPDGERDDSLPGTDGLDLPERYRTLDCVIHYVI